MNTAEDIEELRETKYPKLRVLTGGKGPSEPPKEGNWLAELAEGTTFVARDRNTKDVDNNLYHVLFRALPEIMLLKWELPDGKLLDFYVDPERFSNKFVLRKVLGIVQLQSEPEPGPPGTDEDRYD